MVRITVHECKSEAFDYSRASTPVAKAYELLDDYFCDDAGALSKDAVEKVLLTFRNDRGFYDRSKLKAIKSYSLAWEALLREIQATLEWDDEFPHATKLSSEQVKKWFSSKGRDFKEDLKPLVDAINKQRKTWDEERASNKGESKKCEGSNTPEDAVLYIFTSLKDNDILAGYIDMEVVKNNLADLVEEFEGRFDFDTDRGSFVAPMLLDSNDERDDDSVADKWNRCADLTDTIMELFNIPNGEDSTNENWKAIQWELYDGGITDIYTKDESKKSEAYEDIWRGAKVVSYENAADYIDLPAEEEQEIIDKYGKDYYDNPNAMDEYSEALDDYIVAMFDQDFVYIDGDEIPLAVCREPKILIVQTIDHKDGDKAVELVKKLAKGELKGTSDDGDFVAIMDGVNGNPHFDIYSE